MDGPAVGTVDLVTNTYDALHRLVRSELTGDGTAAVSTFNALDQMTSLADGRGITTSNTYDALGNLRGVASPDSGTRATSYDAAGNVTQSVDGEGRTAAFTYDALNRITSITAPNGTASQLRYDERPNGLGRLTTVVDNSGSRVLDYDVHGRLVSETRGITTSVASVSLTKRFTYDAAGRLASLVYPSGRQVSYARDALGRVSDATLLEGAQSTPVASGMTYFPFGPLTAGTGAGSAPLTWSRDQDGRVAAYSVGNTTVPLEYDQAGRLWRVGTNGAQWTYGYDANNRVTSAVGAAGSYAYQYDLSGNLTSRTDQGATTLLSVNPANNQIATASGARTAAYAYDNTGNLTDDGSRQLTYDGLGRLVEVRVGAQNIRYTVDTFGHRVARVPQ